ncbi:MAG: pyrroloquinoline quinone biosynthesis peptide chaperone PqqD [Panacagrimonas sp.]
MSEAVAADQVYAVARLFRLQWEPAQDAHVLLYPEGMVKLNQSAGEIMKRLDGKRTVAEVTSDCEAAFNANGLLDDVLGFIGAAIEQGWVRRV